MILKAAHIKIVKTLLQKHCPYAEVRAFGSRVRGNYKDWSDLDLALISEKKLPPATIENLNMDFAESDLPFRIDILDWRDISPKFKALIEEKYELLQNGK
ncbi:MAG: nucleotidyltransferase domain-containing protein [Elusimicrobiota bacterium]|nr:nucleotidyltransferase domain-containing protein [Elusimicrobiota bacterium]